MINLFRTLAVVLLSALSIAWAQAPDAGDGEADIAMAPVEIDGRVLFTVRGVSSVPAGERAERIRQRILALARDASFNPEALTVEPIPNAVTITARGQVVLAVLEADARLERANPADLAVAHLSRIRPALLQFREDRSPRVLLRQALVAAGVLAAFLGGCALVFRGRRSLRAALEARLRRRLDLLEEQTHHLVEAQQLWRALGRAIDTLAWVVILVAGFLALDYTLGLFPWSRGLANRLLDRVIEPMLAFGLAFIDYLPNVVFLIVLVVVLRFVLHLTRLFFNALGRGTITITGFIQEWSDPTYKLVRLVILLFGMVVAYPYIPGSNSEAFKGISLFAGLVFSLSSTATLGNMIAGYTMTYRRAFRLGDRVKIGDIVGDVIETRLQVTHLRTPKNEEVIIPNSVILNGEVVNYSSLARTQGLILHTTVGIGYETPWRQVEAMLQMAAERTAGLLKDPVPFVLQTSLGEFAVNYELNAYCGDAQRMTSLYAALHRNILDVFNEYGVQIMTPAYEGDPAEPKVVPRERWHLAPAQVRARDEGPASAPFDGKQEAAQEAT